MSTKTEKLRLFVMMALQLAVWGACANRSFPNPVDGLTGAGGAADYHTLFMVPAGLAALGAVILALGFYPTTHAPTRAEENA